MQTKNKQEITKGNFGVNGVEIHQIERKIGNGLIDMTAVHMEKELGIDGVCRTEKVRVIKNQSGLLNIEHYALGTLVVNANVNVVANKIDSGILQLLMSIMTVLNIVIDLGGVLKEPVSIIGFGNGISRLSSNFI